MALFLKDWVTALRWVVRVLFWVDCYVSLSIDLGHKDL